MKNYTRLFITFLCLSVVLQLGAQSKQLTEKSSLELILQIYTRNSPSPLDAGSLPNFFATGVSSIFLNQQNNPEIQIRYVRELRQDVSVYGGLSYGLNTFNSFIRFSSPGSSTTAFIQDEFITNSHRISYGSSHLGVRYIANVKENDAFNFSLGGKGIFYPSQDLGFTKSGFSDIRGEEYTFDFETDSEDAESKFVAGLELDINFELGFRNTPLKIMMGITIDRVTSSVRELNSQLTVGNLTSAFRHSFGGGRVGVYLGAGYSL